MNALMVGDEQASFKPAMTWRTRHGDLLHLRPATRDDKAVLEDLLQRVGPSGLRFKPLAGPILPSTQIEELLDPDDENHVAILAFLGAGKAPVAGLLMVKDSQETVADLAVAIDEKYRGRGIGWALLKYAGQASCKKNWTSLRCTGTDDDRAIAALNKSLGFTTRHGDGPSPSLVIEQALRRPGLRE